MMDYAWQMCGPECCNSVCQIKAYVGYEIRSAWGVCGAETHNGPHMINIHEV